jgi:hypothetical protein
MVTRHEPPVSVTRGPENALDKSLALFRPPVNVCDLNGNQYHCEEVATMFYIGCDVSEKYSYV